MVSSSASRSLTLLATSTVLVPDCLRICSRTVGSPLTLAEVRGSAMPSSTRATSRSRIGWPSTSRNTTSPKASIDATRPRVRRVTDSAPWSMRPPGMSAFCDCSARATSLTDSFWARSNAVSSHRLTWRLRPPITTTCPTPSELSSRRRRILSANSVMSRTGLSAVTATVITGDAWKSSFSTVGCSTVRGSNGSTRLMRSRTSCAAVSASFSSLKETTTCEMPSDDVEVSVSMPLMVLTDSSILSVTSVSICSGAAPGSRVVTEIVGMSTLGNRSTPRRPKANRPTTVSDRTSTQANTGRCTQSDASHCMTTSPRRERRRPAARRRLTPPARRPSTRS